MKRKNKGFGSFILDILMLILVCGGVVAFLKVNNIHNTDDAYKFLKNKSVATEECYKNKGEGCLVLPEHSTSGGSILAEGKLTDNELSYKGPESGESFMNDLAKFKKTYVLAALDKMETVEPTKDKVKVEEWNYFAPVDGSDCWSVKNEVIADQSSKRALKLVDEYRQPTEDRKKACGIASGSWVDMYTGEKIKDMKNVDVDHVVSLDTAVKHGGADWDTKKKEEFANDKENLVVVSTDSKKSRNSKSISGFKPKKERDQCTFAKNYTSILNKYELKVNDKDKKALSDILVKCNK